MKITHILWGLTMGGIESMVVNIINQQATTHNVELIVINNFYHSSLVKQVSSRCHLIMYHRKVSSKNPLPILKLNLHLLKFNPDIIHIHSAGISKIILLPFPIVRTIHNTRNKCDEYPRMKRLFSISKTVQAYTKEQGFDSILVENGIPTKTFLSKDSVWNPNTILHVIQIGRLDIQQKGQDILIDAIDKLVNSYEKKNIRVHLIGEGEDKSLLEKMIIDKKLEDFIIFEGVKTQAYLKEHLKDYDLLVQPSRYEGFGLTVAEAMASGLPVLVSDIEGPMEIINHGKYGFHFKSEDTNNLAAELINILERGFDDSVIKEAQKHVINKYDVSRTAASYLEYYQLYKHVN